MSGDGVSTTEQLTVALGDRSYQILVGPGLLGEAGTHMLPVLAQRRVIVIADATVAGLHLATLTASLDRAKIAHDTEVMPPGEGTKDFVHLQQLTDRLLDRRVERRTMLVALGGGVIGDLTGVAAALKSERLVPTRIDFKHQFDTPQDASSHVKSVIVGVSLTLIIAEGAPLLGHSQGMFFNEFDGPRQRQFFVKCYG